MPKTRETFGERLIQRIKARIWFGESIADIRAELIGEFKEDEIYLAYQAAKFLLEGADT